MIKSHGQFSKSHYLMEYVFFKKRLKCPNSVHSYIIVKNVNILDVVILNVPHCKLNSNSAFLLDADFI